jgi:drug/metabolite transporter (DMT)-like permease
MTAILWGGAFVAGRTVSRSMDPFAASFLRFGTASVFLLAFMLKAYGRFPTLSKKQVFPVIVLGLTGIFAFSWFFFAGLKTATAGRASLIIATVPAFLALSSSFFFRERLTLLKILGIALSMCGVMVVISHGHPLTILKGNVGLGELLMVGCVANWVIYSLVGKAVMRELPPLITVTYACVIGTACLFFPALAEGLLQGFSSYPAPAWLGILYLGFFASALGFFWFYEGVQNIGPSRAGVFMNLVPISSIALAALVLHESVDLSLAAGGVLVITGVYLTNKS